MRPENAASLLLGAVRARAKMHEFRAAPEDYNNLSRDPGSLFALAVGILGDAAAAMADQFLAPSVESGRPKSWVDADGSIQEMVRFSAVFFDAYLDARLQSDISNEFSLLCATSYYLGDSIGSASVVVRRSEPPDIALGHGLAKLAHAILRGDYRPIEADFIYRDFSASLLAALGRFYALQDEERAIKDMCTRLKSWVYASGSARELLYADIVISLCSQKLAAACRTLLPPASNLPLAVWAPALTKNRFPTELWPAQKLLCTEGLLSGRSAVVQMPTSAGKTRATEFIIRAHFLAKRSSLVVVVAPFRSLCHDIRSDLANAFTGEDVLIDEVSDSYLFDVDLNEIRKHNSVFVVTPEKLLYMLRRAPELAETIGLAIYDEGHQFDGFRRGPSYELLLSSMRISLPAEAQVILISAVIANAPQIADWLVGDPAAVVLGKNLLPTVRNIAFASWEFERAWLKYVSPQDPEQSEFFVPRIVASSELKQKKGERVQRYFPEKGTKRTNTDVGLFLGLHLAGNGSVAVFCGTKESVGTVCKRAVEVYERGLTTSPPSGHSDFSEVSRIAHLAGLHLGDGSDVRRAASLGILSHHSNTPPGLRLAIEHAMKAGLARMVVCTSTLAQGVNFPIRYLIVTSTQQGKEEIKVRDFHNLMGRSGRAGMYTEGNVIFSAPTLIDQKTGFGAWRWDKTKRLLDPSQSEPSSSSILELFASYVQPRERADPLRLTIPTEWLNLTFATADSIANMTKIVTDKFPEVIEKDYTAYLTDRARAVQSIAAYLASYVDFESDLAAERVDELARSTLAHHLADEPTRLRLLEVFRQTAKAIEEAGDLGLIGLIRRSPLPPLDIRELSTWTLTHFKALEAIADDKDLTKAVVDQALRHVHSSALRPLTAPLLVSCLSDWLSGKTYSEICSPLVAANFKVGRYRVTPSHVVNICESGFSYDLAMVVSAIADLTELLSPTLNGRLVTMQKHVKYGLPTLSAIAFFEAGFSDRIVAQALAAAFPIAVDRGEVRRTVQRDWETTIKVLEAFPEYFRTVAFELRG